MKPALIIILSILLTAAAGATIGRIYPPEAGAGESTFIVTYTNSQHYTMKDISATMYVPDIEVRAQDSIRRLRADASSKVYFTVDVPQDLAPDYYPVIVTIQNGDVREKKHTWVLIN